MTKNFFIKFCFNILVLIISIHVLGQATIINKGANVIIKDQITLKTGNFIVKSINGTDGKLKTQGSLLLTGDWNNSATGNELFISGSTGNVIFDGSVQQNIYGTTKFQNIIVQNSLNLDGNMTIAGTASLNSEAISGDGDFELLSSAALKTSHEDGFDGNLTNTGNISLSNQGNYFFTGSEEQATGTRLPNTFNSLHIDKTSGYVTLSQTGLTELNGTFTATSGGLIVNSTSQLTLNGDMELSAIKGLILKSDASGTASFLIDGTVSCTGSAEVQDYLKYEATDYGRNIALPISNGHTDQFENPSAGIYYYNSSTPGWQLINNTSLAIITGYVTKYPTENTLSFTGTLNSGDLSRTNLIRTTTPNNFGWNLIGNPYPSAVDWDLVGKSNVNSAMYFRKVNGNVASYVNGTGNPLGTTGIIPPMQAFWAQVTSGQTTGAVYFSDADRLHSALPLYKEVPSHPIVRLRFNTVQDNDETVVLFNDEATPLFDATFDAHKMISENEALPVIYSLTPDNDKLSINALKPISLSSVVPLGISALQNGQCSIDAFEISNFNAQATVFLEDTKLQVFQNLTLHPVYSFTYNKAEDTHRFRLHFKNVNTSFDSNNADKDEAVQVYTDDNSLYITFLSPDNNTYKIHLYNMLGQLIYEREVNSDGQIYKIDLNTAYAHYIVRVFNNRFSQTEKVSMYR